MKSAFECFQAAAKCQENARASQDMEARAKLVAEAARWLALGMKAKAEEAKPPPSVHWVVGRSSVQRLIGRPLCGGTPRRSRPLAPGNLGRQ